MITYEFLEGQKLSFDPTRERSEYTELLGVWKRCRDAKAGGVKVKAAGTVYLPKLNNDQKESDYDDYKDRAYWYGATGKSIDAFLGMVFRKSPIVTAPEKEEGSEEGMENLLSRSSQDGRSAEELMREVMDEVLTVNRVGLLEDYPSMEDEEGNVLRFTQLQTETAGLRSFTSVYKAEEIINWRTEVIDNEIVATLFVLHETENTENPEDPVIPVVEDKYRILYLADVEGKPEYRQVLVSVMKEKKETVFYVERVIVPLKEGQPLDRIPFWVVDADGVEFDVVEYPVIYDLVEVNMAHYRNSADYEREIHRVSIKTAIFPGWPEGTDDPEIGGALTTPPGEIPFILESKSMSPMTEELTKKEERMATIGAQLLAQKGRYVEAAKTAEIHTRGESSIIASIAKSLSGVFSEVFTFKAAWSIGPLDITVELNTDFDEGQPTAAELTPLMQMLQSGTYSFEAYYGQMDRMEMYPDNWSREKEAEAIAETQEMFAGINAPSEEMTNLQTRMDELEGRQEEEPDEEGSQVPSEAE